MAIEHTKESLEDSLYKAIKNHIDTVSNEIIQEETDEAVRRIRKRIKSKEDQIAVSILKNYEIERRGGDIRITIRHFFSEPEDGIDS